MISTVTVCDSGLTINPLLAERAVESGMIFGLSNAMSERITLTDGAPEQTNFDTYQVLRIDQARDAPRYRVSPVRILSLPTRRDRGDLRNSRRSQSRTAGWRQYSLPVKNAGFAWDETGFAAFIANPRGKIPGNKMVFAGIKDETEIANLWAYLSQLQCRR